MLLSNVNNKTQYPPLTACVCAPGRIHSPTGEETSSPSGDHPWWRVCLQTALSERQQYLKRGVRVMQRKNTSTAAAINRTSACLRTSRCSLRCVQCVVPVWQRLRCQSIDIMHVLSALDLEYWGVLRRCGSSWQQQQQPALQHQTGTIWAISVCTLQSALHSTTGKTCSWFH